MLHQPQWADQGRWELNGGYGNDKPGVPLELGGHELSQEADADHERDYVGRFKSELAVPPVVPMKD